MFKPLVVLGLIITVFLVSCSGTIYPPKTPLGELFEGETDAFSLAMQQTGVMDTLMDESKSFEVFVPYDIEETLKAMGMTQETFLARDDLEEMMKYHVLTSDRKSTDFVDGASFETLNGANVRVSVAENGAVYLNDTVVVTYSTPERAGQGWGAIELNGGYINIDGLLLPQEADVN